MMDPQLRQHVDPQCTCNLMKHGRPTMQHEGPTMQLMQHGGPTMHLMQHGGPTMHLVQQGRPTMLMMQYGGPTMHLQLDKVW